MRTRRLRDGRIVAVCGPERPLVLTLPSTGLNDEELLNDVIPDRWKRSADIDSHPRRAKRVIGTVLEAGAVLGTACIILIVSTTDTLTPGTSWRVAHTGLLVNLTLIGICAILPSFVHESLHVYLGNTSWRHVRRQGNGMRTNLNHVLAWRKHEALLAIGSGVYFDILLCATAGAFAHISRCEFASLLASVTLYRILWQFNLFKSRDVRLFLNVLTDRPEGILPNSRTIAAIGGLIDLIVSILYVGLFVIRTV